MLQARELHYKDRSRLLRHVAVFGVALQTCCVRALIGFLICSGVRFFLFGISSQDRLEFSCRIFRVREPILEIGGALLHPWQAGHLANGIASRALAGLALDL